jgi:hypothetical protein
VRGLGLWLVIPAVLLVLCGQPTSPASFGTPSPASSARLESPVTHGWNSYHSQKWGYTINYPASWYDLGNLGAPDKEQYFANRKDIGLPMGMGADGVFFNLSVLSGQCRAAPPGDIDGTAQLTVEGQPITRVTGFLGPPRSEVFWASDASVPKGTNCFAFAFVFGGKAARDANLRITDQMISSFTTSQFRDAVTRISCRCGYPGGCEPTFAGKCGFRLPPWPLPPRC